MDVGGRGMDIGVELGSLLTGGLKVNSVHFRGQKPILYRDYPEGILPDLDCGFRRGQVKVGVVHETPGDAVVPGCNKYFKLPSNSHVNPALLTHPSK